LEKENGHVKQQLPKAELDKATLKAGMRPATPALFMAS
jgi:hypothetical protein